MRIISIVKYAFIVIGFSMLVGTFYSYKNTQDFLKDVLTTEGTVVELVHSRSSNSTIYRPVVEFKTQGGTIVEFASSSGSNPPSYSKGEMVEVLYQQSAPDHAQINDFFSLWGASIILGGMGSIFFLMGFLIILFGSLKNKKKEYLRKNGIPINAKFQSVEINDSLSMNGRNPYQICAQWKNPSTSEIHLFNSENIWFDPTDHINNDEIIVLIEKDNPKKYYVDTSFLPKVAG
ncbi:MAG: DUF3592 domain-containing protein [Desulfobacteraceae bacterium]|nr:DUF3592 domain-containing protein [Desulfobacteraceae bacterium]